MVCIDYQFSNISIHDLYSLTNDAIKYESYAIQIVFLRSGKFFSIHCRLSVSPSFPHYYDQITNQSNVNIEGLICVQSSE